MLCVEKNKSQMEKKKKVLKKEGGKEKWKSQWNPHEISYFLFNRLSFEKKKKELFIYYLYIVIYYLGIIIYYDDDSCY